AERDGSGATGDELAAVQIERLVGDVGRLEALGPSDQHRPSPFAVTISHAQDPANRDRKSTRLNSSHVSISYAVFCLKKKNDTHVGYSPYEEAQRSPLS